MLAVLFRRKNGNDNALLFFFFCIFHHEIITIIFRLLLAEWPSVIRSKSEKTRSVPAHGTTTIQLNYTLFAHICNDDGFTILISRDNAIKAHISLSGHTLYVAIIGRMPWIAWNNIHEDEKKTSCCPLEHEGKTYVFVLSASINSMLPMRIVYLFTWTRVFLRCAFSIGISISISIFFYAPRLLQHHCGLYAETRRTTITGFSCRSFCARE